MSHSPPTGGRNRPGFLPVCVAGLLCFLATTTAFAAQRESELDTKAWIEAAGKVVRGGDGAPFKNFLERELGEKVPAAGLGGAGGGRGGSGRGGPGGG